MNRGAQFESGLIWLLASLVALAIVAPYLWRFRRRRGVDRARLAEARELGIDRPLAQFPFIDSLHCIGCGACVRACPEGDVLGVVGGAAVVINGLRCVGHGRCADACPVGAIEIGLGDTKGRRDMLVLTGEAETTLPGVFVAGELSGLALIRNAVEQGRAVVETIAARLAAGGPRAVDSGVADVLVVGAGPAGLTAALAARLHGLSAKVVDQCASLGGSILHFPRRKLVLTRPVGFPGGGGLDREEYSKEEILDMLEQRIESRRLSVSYGERLESLARDGDLVAVRTSKETHRARAVVLALGRRGTPRKLGVPGEECSKVMYQLRDAETYRGQRILVVGGGDSAIEAAVGLVRQSGNKVTISYRKNAFYRIKRKNQLAIESLIERGRVRTLFDSTVESIEPQRVNLRIGSESQAIDNDYVFVFAGGDPPFELLRRSGIRFGGDEPPAPAVRQPPAQRAATPAAIASLLLTLLTAAAMPTLAQESPHGEIKIECTDCHSTADWKDVRPDPNFRHQATGYALTGVHARTACTGCHSDRVFSKVATACADCHSDAHQGELGLACANCHDTQHWDVKTEFSRAHNATLFPLVGGHARVDCEACHTGAGPNQFARTTTDCATCHRADFLAASTPAHSGAPADCQRCHTESTISWLRTNFRHPDRFALTGAHATLTCESCHRGSAAATSPDCYSCHRPDFEATTAPNHVRGGLSTLCAACHSTTSWTSGTFDHFRTGFALDGAHAATACANCHANGYAGTPSDCYSCHRGDYSATSNPNHSSAGFPTTCQNCHTTSGWTGAAFNHASTGFALVGAHASAPCADCHATGYAGTPTACYSCHRAEYDATNSPDHAASGIPTSCENCHSPTTWGGSFDHDGRYFPIYSGKHQGRWSTCSNCHPVSSNFTIFQCTNCHSRSDTDGRHSGVGGYTYDSAACYRCHPDGQGDD